MKKSLLATVVAVLAAAGMASAAEGPKDQPKAGHAEMNKGADVKTEPEMKKGAAVQAPSKAETTGAGTEMKSEPRTEMNKSDANKSQMNDSGAAASKSSAEERSAPAAKSAADQKAAPAAKSAADTKAGSDAKSNAAAADSKSSTSVSLNAEQKTKIRTSVIQSGSAPKVSRSSINFNISVGTVVPRSVHFVTVPETIVEIHPAWRGYSYFVVDDEIIIIEPGSGRIIAVLEV